MNFKVNKHMECFKIDFVLLYNKQVFPFMKVLVGWKKEKQMFKLHQATKK